MGSVSNYGQCPYCKGEESLFDDFYYKSNEVYQLCIQCGYFFEHRIQRDDKGCVVLLDKNNRPDNTNIVYEKIENPKPYGLLTVQSSDRGASMYPLASEDKMKEMLDNVPEDFTGEIHISRYIRGKGIVKEKIR